MDEPKYPIEVQLSGEDGNAGAIMGNVVQALRAMGASSEEIAEYRQESMSGDYDNLLQVAHKWVIVL